MAIEIFFIVIFYLFISTEYFNTEYCTRVRVKFGNIMSGFPKCYDCRESHLLCDIYRKRWQTKLWLSSCYRIRSAKHKSSCKSAFWVFSLRDFVLESLFCGQRLWILLICSRQTLTYRPHGLNDEEVIIYGRFKGCLRKVPLLMRDVASNKAVIV